MTGAAELCPQPLSVWLVSAIVTGICTVLAALATFIKQVRSDAKADERHAYAQRARELIRDEVASIVQVNECEARRAAREKEPPGPGLT